MAYITYRKLWESEIDNIVSKKEKVQNLNVNQINFKYMIV